ncbi:MAG TPA: hypothetical protein VHV83_12160 [Armatimonadota bacterium]|nr:hypothetical protein [Armatimonadota bacterium]
MPMHTATMFNVSAPIFNLIVYCSLQIGATLLMAYGGTAHTRWMPCFIIANIINCTSVWALMRLYQGLNVNIAMALAVGIAFTTGQVALGVCFHQHIGWLQIVGIAVVLVGVILLTVRPA